MRVVTAVRTFFRVLFDREFAGRVELAMSGEAAPPAARTDASRPPMQPKHETRSEAISLLAALQREARLVDFLQEPLEGYSDAQIGAAARDVHRECRGVLQRM